MAISYVASSQSTLLHARPILPSVKRTLYPIQLQQVQRSYCSHRVTLSSDQFPRSTIGVGVVSSRSIRSSSAVFANTVDSVEKLIGDEPEIGGGDFGSGSSSGRGGGGGGGDGGGDDGRKEDGEEIPEDGEKKTGLSMSQKLTIGYAVLVGVGGLMGYLKSGSQKSLLAGGLTAAILFYVYSQLPTNPVLASSIGVGISAALTGVMGSRFLKSRKVFPAGIVSFVSLIMSGGYVHGIMRSLH